MAEELGPRRRPGPVPRPRAGGGGAPTGGRRPARRTAPSTSAASRRPASSALSRSRARSRPSRSTVGVRVHGDARAGAVGARRRARSSRPSTDGWVVLLAGEFEARGAPDGRSHPPGRARSRSTRPCPRLAGCCPRPTRAEVRDLAAFAVRGRGGGRVAVVRRRQCRVREGAAQFGRPIGQFQGVKHRCANMLARTELARAAVWDAARALDDGDAAPLAVASAAALTVDAYLRDREGLRAGARRHRLHLGARCARVPAARDDDAGADRHVDTRGGCARRELALGGATPPARGRPARARRRRSATTCACSSRRSTGSTRTRRRRGARRRRLPRTAVAVALGSRRRRGRAARHRRRVPRRQGPAARPHDRRRGRSRR